MIYKNKAKYEKCEKCIWITRIDGNTYYCMMPSCGKTCNDSNEKSDEKGVSHDKL